jgi:hypothetical protein
METQQCVKCGGQLKAPQGINTTGDKQIAIYITAVTVGVRPRLRSRLRRSVMCMPCAVSIAMAPPPEGAFNQTVYESLNEVNSQTTAIMEAAWEQKQNPRAPLKLMPGSKQDKSLATPMLRSAPILSAS